MMPIYGSTQCSWEIESVVSFDLKYLVDWSQANKLSLNKLKSKLALFRSNKSGIITSNIKIRLNQFKLEHVSLIKYLGTLRGKTLLRVSRYILSYKKNFPGQMHFPQFILKKVYRVVKKSEKYLF